MISILLTLAIIFWIIAIAKKLIFWTYLWQLKEYHIGRFLDHFHTHKGKRLFFNIPIFFKAFILLGIFVTAEMTLTGIKSLFIYLAIFVFFFEALLFIRNIKQKSFKRPVLTRKTSVILNSGFSLIVLIIFSLFVLDFSLTKFIFVLLFFDTIAPVIFSGVVLAFQPVAVILRNKAIKMAKRKRAAFDKLLVIGVTGSYGKTSTKEYLATILSERFNVLKTREHQNSEVGIAQCVLNELNEDHRIFVVEMGAYNRGGIKFLCDIVRPKIGVLTGINEQHMATFGSQENIIKAKYELIESLPRDGVAFFNAKNEYCKQLYEKTENIKKRTYGENTSSPGEENLAGAKAVAKELGMNDEEIARGAAKIQPWQSGAQLKRGAGGLNIIDATYSSNPSGILAHLESLKKVSGKKVIIMPCLIELGKASKEIHRKIGRKIGEVCDLAIITTRDRLKEIREGAKMSEGFARINKVEILFIEKPEKIIRKIKSSLREGDIILLESRVPAQVIKQLI